MAKYSQTQLALIIQGKAAMQAAGKEVPEFEEQIMKLTEDGGYESLSEKERYWIDRWYATGVDLQQKSAKEMEKYLKRPAIVADIYQVMNGMLEEMFGEGISEDPQRPDSMINLAIMSVHGLIELLVKKEVITLEELSEEAEIQKKKTIEEREEKKSSLIITE